MISVVADMEKSTSYKAGEKFFWQLNQSLLLPGDIDFRWEDYREIVQPDKVSFWVMLGSLLTFILWNVFLTFYLSRIIGPIVGFILTKIIRLKGYNGYISIDSFSISPLAGKAMFRNFRWTCCDYFLHCNDGWVIFSYWKYDSAQFIPNPNSTSRIHFSLNGLQLHIYNRLHNYHKLSKFFGFEKLFISLKNHFDVPVKKLTKSEKSKWDEYYQKIWTLIGYIKLDIGSGRIVVGNDLLPSMLILSFENYISKIKLKESPNVNDQALVNIVADMENLRVSLSKRENFEKSRPPGFVGRHDPPPRTMGDGFVVIQSAHLKLFYSQSLLGLEGEEVQSIANGPIWESVWRFGKNTIFSYGPWADSQRILIQNFFFPPEYRDSEITQLPKQGEMRQFLAHDIRVILLSDSSIDVWFMRGDELNALHVRVQRGSSLDWKIPWSISENGYKSFARVSLLHVESSTSLLYPKFFQCETFLLTVEAHYPRVFNGHQLWEYYLETSKTDIWFVWDLKRFFSDLFTEWNIGSVPDLYTFIPCTWKFYAKVIDNFQLFLVLNDKNWIDTTSSSSSENSLASITVKEIHMNFDLPFIDFCPETVSTKFIIETRGDLVLSFWFPKQNTSALLVHSLMKNAAFIAFNNMLNSNIFAPKEWIKIWRAKNISLSIEYTYYSSKVDISSDLPHHVVSKENVELPKHPIYLPPNNLIVKAVISTSEILLTGILARLIINLKNNYFGLYDQLSNILNDGSNVQQCLYGNVLHHMDHYRPLAVRLCLRLQSIKAHCLVHNSKPDSLTSGQYPVISTKEIVIEIVKSPLDVLVQVVLGRVNMHFEGSSNSDGKITLKSFSFRGKALFSEADIPWDVSFIEYAWMTEIVIGTITAKVHPSQIVLILQFLESFILLADCPDDKLLIPERYETCHHVHNIRSCPYSSLNIVDDKGKLINCVSENDLKYEMVRISIDAINLLVIDEQFAFNIAISSLQFAFCNCHEASFTSNLNVNSSLISIKLLALMNPVENSNTWSCCGEFSLEGINLNIGLPHSPNQRRFIQEKKLFLTKHDKRTMRLRFLWNKRDDCFCYERNRFFGTTDIINSTFSYDKACLVKESIKKVECEAIEIGQSLVYSKKKALITDENVSENSEIAFALEIPNEKKEIRRMLSDESFHSAISSQFISLSHHMTCPILSTPILSNTYSTFLSSFRIRDHCIDSSSFDGMFFEKKCVGVNDITFGHIVKQKRTSPTNQSGFAKSSNNVDYNVKNDETFSVRGTLASNIKIFATPLCLEIIEHIGQSLVLAITSVHPVFIMQHLYTKCVFGLHAQPLIVHKNAEKSGNAISIDLTLPVVEINLFHCGLIEKTIQSYLLEDSASHLTRSGMVCFILQESSFLFSEGMTDFNETNIEYKYAHCHAQFLEFVESVKMDFTHNKVLSSCYSTNWHDLNCNDPLNKFDLRVIADLDIPEISISVNSRPLLLSERSSESTLHCQLSMGPIHMSFGLCKPVDQTNSNEWPLFDVFAPCVNAWTCSIHRFTHSMNSNFLQIDGWIDIILIKTLSDVLDCTVDQVFANSKSCFDSVRVLQSSLASCPSCKLTQILMRYSINEDLSAYWNEIDLVDCSKLIPYELRKQALIALLSHCQTIICSSVKLVDSKSAKRFVHLPARDKERLKINIEPVDVVDFRLDSRNSGFINERHIMDKQKNMDLYHWILAKHKEYKEATSKTKIPQKTLEDSSNINLMEINLSIFFWSIYEERNLEQSWRGRMRLPDLNIEWSVECSEVKIDLLEPKMISSSNVNYLSLTKHHLFHLESFMPMGQLHLLMQLDEYKLRPKKALCNLLYTSTIQNIRFTLSVASVLFLNDLSRVIRSYSCMKTHLENSSSQKSSAEEVTKEERRKEAPESSSGSSNEYFHDFSWVDAVLDKLKDYNRTRGGDIQKRNFYVQTDISGEHCFKMVILEMALTHLFVSLTFKKIQLSHNHKRDEIVEQKKQLLDLINLSLQRSYLILSEFVVGLDAKHIISFSIKSSTFSFKREREIDKSINNFVNLSIGDIEGNMPIHAQNLHEVVLRNVSQLTEQMTRLEYDESFVGEYSPHLHDHQIMAVIFFEVHLSSVELTAQLLPSLKVKYRLEHLESSGYTGSSAKFKSVISNHVLFFTVSSADEKRLSPISSDIFTLALPRIIADGIYRSVTSDGQLKQSVNSDEKGKTATENDRKKEWWHTDDGNDKGNLQLHEGGYFDIELIIGKLDHSFTTDLLNQVLFAEQCFRSELSSLINRISMDQSPHPTFFHDHSLLSQNRFLFILSIKEEATPWLQLTASTPTSIAVRLTFDNISATLTNMLAQKNGVYNKRLYGKATIGVNAKLGQLVKSAMFEEIDAELQEFATFMTQISFQNKESSVHTSYSYVITVKRPILLVKSTAIDKALLLWLNYKNAYDYWREERSKLLKSERRDSRTTASFSSVPEMNVNLSLKIVDGAYICMPLYSADLSTDMSALIISLQSSDITVCIQKELACQAAFHNFKVRFIDNFDDQALNDSLLDEKGDSTGTNFFYFPEGTYQIVSRASAASGPSQSAKWLLLVKWQMRGMVIDLDYRIGKLIVLLMNTFSSLTSDNIDDDWGDLIPESLLYDSDDEKREDDDIDSTGELGSLAQEERVQWIERKMHEQSVLVNDLIQCGATEPAIEKERRTLRKLELARFRQFRKSVLDKLKRNAMRHKRRFTEARKNESFSRELPRNKSSTVISTNSRYSQQSEYPSSKPENIHISDTVNMDISVQIDIESGMCTLRAAEKNDEQLSLFIKRPSTRDLRSKITSSNNTITTLTIPSVSIKAYYVSIDFNQSQHISRSVQSFLAHKYGKSSQWKRPAFYLSMELASMPQESLVTPSLADFIEQLVDALPSGVMTNSSLDSNATSPEVPIVEIDTSILPLDILLFLTVQSSTIRFEGQQQRSAAADCLLKLPSLTLMASTRPMTEGTEGTDIDLSVGGIHLSATLSAFSLNVYSPHQRSTAHDALSLTLDHLSVLISRSKNSRFEIDNKVQFVLTVNIGSASFNYDMRRLAELISFPKPWYRRAIVHRFFFGDRFVRTPTQRSSSPMSKLSQEESNIQKKEWCASVIFAIEWRELNINAQMANTMGNTKLCLRDGVFRGHCQLNSKSEKILMINFGLKSANLSAYGGTISGQISINDLLITCENNIILNKPPRNSAKIKLAETECRIEWMSRPIFIARCDKASIIIQDDWSTIKDDTEQVIKAYVSVALNISWEDLQLIITKTTVDDLIKIAMKLRSFFQEQMRNSQLAWGIVSPQVNENEIFKSENNLRHGHCQKYRHWPSVLDTLTEIQSKQKILPLPKGNDGVTAVGGILELTGGRFSLACMNGEMNASSWALFHMLQPSILFEPEAQYAFISEKNDVGVSVTQRLTVRLGDLSSCHSALHETKALVCRIQQSRGCMVRQTSSISTYLEHIIGDPLKQLSMHPTDSSQPTAHHSVLQLFQFPTLDVVVSTLQKQEMEIGDVENFIPEVLNSFICEFHDTVNVQTDFNAQVSFLPELLKTYIKTQDQAKEERVADTSRDFRRYICEKWIVDPKICFIDRFKWNPPVIDEILKKLQIFDHRRTIPKAFQRGILDPCDALLAQLNLAVMSIGKKSAKSNRN